MRQLDCQNRLLRALDPDDFARLAPFLEAEDLPRGRVLVEPGEPIQHVQFLESGIASQIVITPDLNTVQACTCAKRFEFAMWDPATSLEPLSIHSGYRAFPLDERGAIEGPAIELKARCDEDALREAEAELGLNASEVWIGTRRVPSTPS